jgi:hypothetical protein
VECNAGVGDAEVCLVVSFVGQSESQVARKTLAREGEVEQTTLLRQQKCAWTSDIE